MNRQERGFRAALKAARESDFYSHRVGAAVYVGANCISTASNCHKSHPLSNQWTRHAEFNSLVPLIRTDLSNATLYVARLTRSDRVSCAKPCLSCQEIIKKFGVKKVYYTNYDGVLEKLS